MDADEVRKLLNGKTSFTLKEVIYVAGVIIGAAAFYVASDSRQNTQLEVLERGRQENKGQIEALRAELSTARNSEASEVQALRIEVSALRERLAEHDAREKLEMDHFRNGGRK